MTNEEALKKAKRELAAYKDKVSRGQTWCEGEVQFWERVESALERAIPKRPEEYIKEKVESCSCPEPSHCTVATTGYSQERRRAICTKCWEDYIKENNQPF